MGKFQEQQTALAEKKAARKESEKTGRETLGKYYYDLSKLAFATSVLNGSGFVLVDGMVNNRIANTIIGLVITVIFALLGYRTINNYKL